MLYLDEVRIENERDVNLVAALLKTQKSVRRDVQKDTLITWEISDGEFKTPNGLERFVIYRSLDGKRFEPIGIQTPGVGRYTDYLGEVGTTARYKVTASNQNYRESAASETVTATTRAMSDDELLTMLQEECFRYYWDGARPASGMTRARVSRELSP
jgi:fibronectin type 3 domain-containing protein